MDLKCTSFRDFWTISTILVIVQKHDFLIPQLYFVIFQSDNKNVPKDVVNFFIKKLSGRSKDAETTYWIFFSYCIICIVVKFYFSLTITRF